MFQRGPSGPPRCWPKRHLLKQVVKVMFVYSKVVSAKDRLQVEKHILCEPTSSSVNLRKNLKGFKWVKRHREWSKKNKVPYQQLTQALFFVRYFHSIIITWAGECAPRLPCLPHVVLFGRSTHWQQIKLDHNVSFRPNHPSTSMSLEFIVLVV